MKIKELKDQVKNILASGGAEDPQREATEIMCAVLNKDRAYLFAHANETLEEFPGKILEFAKRRSLGEPLQYVLGTAAFMDLDLKVDSRALIPRPETEELAERAELFLSDIIGKQFNLSSALGTSPKTSLRILDLCTGSGAIAIYLAHKFPEAEVTASDISPDALRLAEENAKKCGVSLTLVKSDLFQNIKGNFDLITANPPYIPAAGVDALDASVREYEPRLALDGGPDGLDIIKKILQETPARLRRGGALFMEIGDDQGCAVRNFALKMGFSEVKIFRDMEKRDRILFAAP